MYTFQKDISTAMRILRF